MSNHIESGYARTALYNLRRANRAEAADYGALTPGDGEQPAIAVLELVNENGDGLELVGTADEIDHYLELVSTHVKRHLGITAQ